MSERSERMEITSTSLLAAVTRAQTRFVVQADKGRGEWYDFAILCDDESVGRSDIAHIRRERDFERHRLVRRTIIDVEIPTANARNQGLAPQGDNHE